MKTQTKKTARKTTKKAALIEPSYALIKGVCVNIALRSVNDKKTSAKVARYAIDVLTTYDNEVITVWHDEGGRPAPTRAGEVVTILSKHVVGKYAKPSLTLVTSAA